MSAMVVNRADETEKAYREQQVRAREEYEHHQKMESFTKIKNEAELRAARTESDANQYSSQSHTRFKRQYFCSNLETSHYSFPQVFPRKTWHHPLRA